MTDEQLNRRVAELAGWKFEKWSGGTRMIRPDGTIHNSCYAEDWRLPQYTQSRDAIIGLVEKLDDDAKEKVVIELCGMYSWQPVISINYVCEALTAPARDLCMAYVKVMECSRKHEPA